MTLKSSLIASVALGATALAGCAHPPALEATACEAARAAEAQPLVRVPFDIVGGRIYVQARVNGGGPYRFAVDTGASGMGRADASLTSALHLIVTGNAQSSDGIATATVNAVHLDSLALGHLQRENLDVITRDYSSSVPASAAISGIIGRDFFADGVLVIDYPSRMLTFSRARGLTANNSGALSYERPFRVFASIGAVSTTANLDTGAGVGLVLPRSVYDQVSTSPLEAAGHANLTNGPIETGRATVHGPLRFGDVNAADLETRVADRYPEVMVGADILQHYLIAIDQRTRLVAVCAPRT
jgi:hypothetical protein